MTIIHLKAVAPCETCGKLTFVEGDPATTEELEQRAANPCEGHNPECKCDDWVHGIEAISGAIMMSAIHGGNYSGVPFVVCPWCGTQLVAKP